MSRLDRVLCSTSMPSSYYFTTCTWFKANHNDIWEFYSFVKLVVGVFKVSPSYKPFWLACASLPYTLLLYFINGKNKARTRTRTHWWWEYLFKNLRQLRHFENLFFFFFFFVLLNLLHRGSLFPAYVSLSSLILNLRHVNAREWFPCINSIFWRGWREATENSKQEKQTICPLKTFSSNIRIFRVFLA